MSEQPQQETIWKEDTSLVESLNFASVEPIEEEVILPPEKKGGQPLKCILCEATEDVAIKFNNAITRSAKMNDGRVTGVEGLADAELILVQGCLFQLVEQPNGQVVRRPFVPGQIKSMLHRVVKPIFERAKRISNLGGAGNRTRKTVEDEITKLREELTDMEANDPKDALPSANQDSSS